MTEKNTRGKRKTAAETLREAEQVHGELSAALRSAGIVLPSLGVDALAYGDEKPQPLVELGRCNVQTARELTAVLRARPTRLE